MSKDTQSPGKPRRKEGYTTFTITLSPREREVLEELSRRMGKTRAGASRAAHGLALHLLQAQQDSDQQTALVNKAGRQPVILHFVM